MHTLPGINERDTRRTLTTLGGFKRYAPAGPNGWYLVGGLVERHHLQRLQARVPQRPFNGVDVVLPNGISSLKDGYVERYLVVQLHVGVITLIDRYTGVKLNAFSPRHKARPEEVRLADKTSAYMQPLPQQVVSLLEDLLKLNSNPPQPVDTKQFEYMEALYRAIGHERQTLIAVQDTWRARHPDEPTFQEALELARALRERRSGQVRRGVFTGPAMRLRQLFISCAECERNARKWNVELASPWHGGLLMARQRLSRL